MNDPGKNNKITIGKAAIYFFLSILFTGWFIAASPLYISNTQKILSCSIAGGKWLLQILAALILLGDKKWIFIKNIGITCATGSAILLPYCISSAMAFDSSNNFFLCSLIIAVLVMIPSYYTGVRNAAINIKWWIGWLFSLVIAITLQLTIVFHVIKLNMYK